MFSKNILIKNSLTSSLNNNLKSNYIQNEIKKFISTTTFLQKKSSGRYKTTINRTKGLTYEQSYKPYQIGLTKSWTSFNTSNLYEGLRKSETLTEDMILRRIVTGFWPTLVMGDIVIKRRANIIYLAFFVASRIRPEKVYFLTGFTEEILSLLLKCPVKLEIQSGTIDKSMIVKYV